MLYIHLSYLRAFRKYAQSHLNKYSGFIEIGNYAGLLTEKANQLITRAALNKTINLANLQKDLFEAGGIYIQKFTAQFREEKPGPPKKQYDRPDKTKTENSNRQ